LFSKIKHVYDVLIDPHKRAIYDSVGEKGLAQDGLQVVVRSKTPKEIREEYERLAKDNEERRLQKLTASEVCKVKLKKFDLSSH
jgi:DnaJ family protein C protein 11